MISIKTLCPDPWVEREASILRVLEKNPNFKDYKTILYIGAKGNAGGRHLNLFKGFEITLLEAWKENADYLKTRWKNVIEADIRDYVESGDQYDVIMWWHGPEHLTEEDLAPVLEKMKKMAKGLIICGCPCGTSVQGVHKGNPFEVHASYLQPEFFNEVGYNTETLLNANGQDGKRTNITSWWKPGKENEDGN